MNVSELRGCASVMARLFQVRMVDCECGRRQGTSKVAAVTAACRKWKVCHLVLAKGDGSDSLLMLMMVVVVYDDSGDGCGVSTGGGERTKVREVRLGRK
ncbi:hypothetical protein QVD17_00308 [Tagetes erecta]|uniref:Uncharacterized protein n=1 Tax=Tagetes erecta TaxID=13708 RepID=A0AAD8L8E3_TARER|nr:hypothetical protein QVD17_00308 [Tagetes erecta]